LKAYSKNGTGRLPSLVPYFARPSFLRRVFPRECLRPWQHFYTELVFRARTSGSYGALTEAFCDADPAWTAGISAMILLALVNHSVELKDLVNALESQIRVSPSA